MIFAGATVIIALCGLVVAKIPFLAVMGYAAAVGRRRRRGRRPDRRAGDAGAGRRAAPPRPGSRAARNAVVEPGDTHTLGAKWVGLVTKVPALTAYWSIGVLS